MDKHKAFNVRFESGLVDELDALAKASRRSRTQVIDLLLRAALEGDPERVLGIVERKVAG